MRKAGSKRAGRWEEGGSARGKRGPTAPWSCCAVGTRTQSSQKVPNKGVQSAQRALGRCFVLRTPPTPKARGLGAFRKVPGSFQKKPEVSLALSPFKPSKPQVAGLFGVRKKTPYPYVPNLPNTPRAIWRYLVQAWFADASLRADLRAAVREARLALRFRGLPGLRTRKKSSSLSPINPKP